MLDLHKRWLARLASMIDLDHQGRAVEAWRRLWADEPMDPLPQAARPPADDGEPWPSYAYNDAFADPEKMLMNELGGVYATVRGRGIGPLNIRANYGTVILPSILGGPWQLTDNSLPWAHELPGGRDALRALIDRGPADPTAGLGSRCFETAAYYREVLAKFPPLDRAIDIYHPDLQGPYDVAHLLAGPDIFLAGYDEPELVERLVDVVTRTYAAFMRRWIREVGIRDHFGLTTHWGFYIRGQIMLRNDTTIMLRAEHYRRFVQPFDGRLLGEFGGAIHFCGKADQVHEPMLATPGLAGIHSSQPDLNDHQRFFRMARERKLVVLSWPRRLLPGGVDRGVYLSAD